MEGWSEGGRAGGQPRGGALPRRGGPRPTRGAMDARPGPARSAGTMSPAGGVGGDPPRVGLRGRGRPPPPRPFRERRDGDASPRLAPLRSGAWERAGAPSNRRTGRRLGGGERAARSPPGPKGRLTRFQPCAAVCSPRGCVAAPAAACLAFPGGLAGCSVLAPPLQSRQDCFWVPRGVTRDIPTAETLPLWPRPLPPESELGWVQRLPPQLSALRGQQDRHLTLSLTHLQPKPAAKVSKTAKIQADFWNHRPQLC